MADKTAEPRWGLTDTDKATFVGAMQMLKGLVLLVIGVGLLVLSLRLWGVF